MKFTYYPGCSLKGLGKAYEESFLALFKALDIQVQELEDWNCCGATAYMSVDETDAVVLAARNLAMAEKKKNEIITPCSGCYLVLNKANHYLEKYPEINQKVRGALEKAGIPYDGKVNTRHPLDVLVNDFGLDKLKKRIQKPLKGLKVACYYGCQIVRPFATFDDSFYPVTLDNLMQTLGAEVVPYPLKTKCCGGTLSGTLSEVGNRLCFLILKEAVKRGADMIVTVCPLCHFNLDTYQDAISSTIEKIKIPVLYFTQLAGLAIGLPERELGLQRQIVPVDKILREKGLVTT